MKSVFGVLLVTLLVFSFYIENKSDPTSLSKSTFQQAEAYDQLIDIEEGEVSETTPVDHLPGPNVGDRAINFKLDSLDGKSITLSELKGKKVIVNFWATWCPPCKEEMPVMQEFYTKYGKEVEVLAINIDPQYNVKEYQKSLGLTFPILLDTDDKINNAYDILTVPTTFVINEQGIITHKQIGAITNIDSLTALIK
ncbi:TlpA family protein disulfide reductase [Rossellomorea vietnamensis]|uniref:TlpA family protein disulfide reductase n=1 Tax=Rossellomorea vietnamensis TaxID=218284 RepID=A0ACD4C968_9BACI|nr:TlpA disulfide reductase family protein [Rossellomorea vietnamensis]UXH45022.1 TlpA family protein disulfide reductase [Rossellomorea vietnamensis]